MSEIGGKQTEGVTTRLHPSVAGADVPELVGHDRQPGADLVTPGDVIVLVPLPRPVLRPGVPARGAAEGRVAWRAGTQERAVCAQGRLKVMDETQRYPGQSRGRPAV